MALDQEKVNALLGLIASAESDGGDCDSCFERLAEFAEAELEGKALDQALKAVETHLEQCICCQHEYQALIEGLRAIGE